MRTLSIDLPSLEAARRAAEALTRCLSERGERLAVAESCTGGLIAALMTERSGSSRVFEGGVVVYSNPAKHQLLGVTESTLGTHGAVSGSTVLEMAEGLRKVMPGAQWFAAVSGIAGPDGGTTEKPVGTIWMAFSGCRIAPTASRLLVQGDREAIRYAAVAAVLGGVLRTIEGVDR